MVLYDHKIGLNAIISRLVNGHLLFNSTFKVICRQEGKATFSVLSTSRRHSLLNIPTNDFGLFVNSGFLFLDKTGVQLFGYLNW